VRGGGLVVLAVVVVCVCGGAARRRQEAVASVRVQLRVQGWRSWLRGAASGEARAG
jgi:hypothetical protein